MLHNMFIVISLYIKVKYKTFIGFYFEVSKLIHIFVHVNNKRQRQRYKNYLNRVNLIKIA